MLIINDCVFMIIVTSVMSPIVSVRVEYRRRVFLDCLVKCVNNPYCTEMTLQDKGTDVTCHSTFHHTKRIIGSKQIQTIHLQTGRFPCRRQRKTHVIQIQCRLGRRKLRVRQRTWRIKLTPLHTNCTCGAIFKRRGPHVYDLEEKPPQNDIYLHELTRKMQNNVLKLMSTNRSVLEFYPNSIQCEVYTLELSNDAKLMFGHSCFSTENRSIQGLGSAKRWNRKTYIGVFFDFQLNVAFYLLDDRVGVVYDTKRRDRPLILSTGVNTCKRCITGNSKTQIFLFECVCYLNTDQTYEYYIKVCNYMYSISIGNPKLSCLFTPYVLHREKLILDWSMGETAVFWVNNNTELKRFYFQKNRISLLGSCPSTTDTKPSVTSAEGFVYLICRGINTPRTDVLEFTEKGQQTGRQFTLPRSAYVKVG